MPNRWWVKTGHLVIFTGSSRILKDINHFGL